MKSLVSIDISLDAAGPFASSGRERRAAVARCLSGLFGSTAWRAGDEPLEAAFQAVAIEHRYEDREAGASVRVREAPALRDPAEARRGLRLVREGTAPAPLELRDDELDEMAGEARLYLEAVSLAFLDRDVERRGGRLCLGARRFRETAEQTGRAGRVRGVYRSAVWEKMLRAFGPALGEERAAFARDAVREHHTVWPLDLEFTAGFFPICLELFRLAVEERAKREEIDAISIAGRGRLLRFAAGAESV